MQDISRDFKETLLFEIQNAASNTIYKNRKNVKGTHMLRIIPWKAMQSESKDLFKYVMSSNMIAPFPFFQTQCISNGEFTNWCMHNPRFSHTTFFTIVERSITNEYCKLQLWFLHIEFSFNKIMYFLKYQPFIQAKLVHTIMWDNSKTAKGRVTVLAHYTSIYCVPLLFDIPSKSLEPFMNNL